MAAQKGREMLIYIGDGASPQVFSLIAGLRDTTLTLNEQEVDITTKDDVGYRRLLDGRIMQSASISGSGVFKDDAVINTVRSVWSTGAHRSFRCVIPGDGSAGGTFEGEFRITSFEYSGTHDGEVQYSVSLSSDGNVSYTATP